LQLTYPLGQKGQKLSRLCGCFSFYVAAAGSGIKIKKILGIRHSIAQQAAHRLAAKNSDLCPAFTRMG
jgi:hypothetical protein